MIPILFIEEHNEAFLSWHIFIKKGYIKSQGNYLLHVDHHDDFESGAYNYDPCNIPDYIDGIRKITYDDLGIANFIVPAVQKKIFSTVHIVKNLIPMREERKSLVSICKDNRTVSVREYIPFLHKEHIEESPKEYSLFSRIDNGLGDIKLETSRMPEEKYVLDLDLDYFCWDNSLSTRNPKRIEITKSAFDEYQSNLYHPFRILPIRLLKAVEDGGRYYLEYREAANPEKVFSKECIEKRVKRLVEWLDNQEARPAAIDICSSRYSGYLPGYAWPFVKECFMKEISFRCWDAEDIGKAF